MHMPDHPPRQRPTRWLLALALVAGNFLLHKPISDVCDAFFARVGRAPYEWTSLLGVGALALVGAALLLRGGAPALRSGRTLAALAVLALATVAAQRWLLVSNVELIHLPQFGLLAALLVAAGLPPRLAWLAASAAGVLDESYQRLVIYAAVPNVYFDWNDIVLNALGAAWAVLLACGGRVDPSGPDERRGERAALAIALVGLAAALWLAPPRLVAIASFPYWRPPLGLAATGRDYHVMPAGEGVAALLLLWVLVAAGTGSRSAAAGRGAAMVLLLLPALAGGCATRPPPPRPPAATPPFFITFWCGPPPALLTDARAAEIRAAGFDVVGAPCEGLRNVPLNRAALDVAARHGLTLWVADPRVDQYLGRPPDFRAQLDAAVADYADHPALGGYFLLDEPDAAGFAELAPVVAHLRRHDPTHLPYINLMPPYLSAEALGSPSYAEHLEQYLTVVQPPLLSVQYYPFRRSGDRPGFLATLALVRAAALRAEVPWMLIVQAMPHGHYRDPSEAELSWQVFSALAYGARGISYFAYWTPVQVEYAARWRFRRGLVEDGVATDNLAEAARVNGTARALATALDGFTSVAMLDGGRRADAPPAAAPIAGVAGPATVGLFAAADGTRAALVVNQDYRAAQRVRVSTSRAVTQRLDPARDQWVLEYGADVSLDLPAGGAALLRWPATARSAAGDARRAPLPAEGDLARLGPDAL